MTPSARPLEPLSTVTAEESDRQFRQVQRCTAEAQSSTEHMYPGKDMFDRAKYDACMRTASAPPSGRTQVETDVESCAREIKMAGVVTQESLERLSRCLDRKYPGHGLGSR
jgi:hypothetical protein